MDTNLSVPHPAMTAQQDHDWELVRSVPNGFGSTIDFVLIPERKERDLAYYQEIVTAVCGTRDRCMVDFWTDRAHIPTSAWIPSNDLDVMTAEYERSPSYKTPVLHLACWLYPSKEVGEAANCFYMPGAKMPWDKPDVATSSTPEAINRNKTAGAIDPAVVIAIAVVGLILIIVAFMALLFCFRIAGSTERPKHWRGLLAGTFAFGLVLACASWPGTYFLGYPLPDPEGGYGRIAGIPFVAAWFDSEGRDYVGTITLPAVIGNAVFWLLIPQMMLASYGKRHQRLEKTKKSIA
jgi:hypothetical protein